MFFWKQNERKAQAKMISGMTECIPRIVEFNIIDQVLMDMLKRTVVSDRHGRGWFRSHLTEYSLFVRINGMQVNRVQ